MNAIPKQKPDISSSYDDQKQAEEIEKKDNIEIVWSNFKDLSKSAQEAKWENFEQKELSKNLFLRHLGRDNNTVIASFKVWLAND